MFIWFVEHTCLRVSFASVCWGFCLFWFDIEPYTSAHTCSMLSSPMANALWAEHRTTNRTTEHIHARRQAAHPSPQTNTGNHPTPTHTYACDSHWQATCILFTATRSLPAVALRSLRVRMELVVQSRCSFVVSSFASRSAARSCLLCCCLLAVGCWLVFLGTSRHCKRRPFSVWYWVLCS